MARREEKMKLKLTWKLWILIIFLIFSFLSIFVSSNGIAFFQKGVIVNSVISNSTASESGLLEGQIIKSIDNVGISSVEDYSNFIKDKFDGENKVKMSINTKESELIYYSAEPPQITVEEIPKTNIKTGLDISGGSRALVQAEDKELNSDEINDLVDVTRNRLNVYGLSDVLIKPVSDLSGNNYMLVEIAGATPKNLEELISQQGKFEAKIGNETVFIGGEKDIASVSRSAQESRIYCSQNSNICNFEFLITLSPKAAERHAEITKNLDLNSSNPEYLDKKLDFYLDDKLETSLLIGADLKGRVTTQVLISGSGTGEDIEQAYENAKDEMKKLQTILITGSLPYKLEIVKLDTISPFLGEGFVKSILIAGFFALVAVAIVIFIRYRQLKASIALLVISLSEIIIILGVASLIGWNLDLPSIAGILATIGTGLDDLIILIDESRQGEKELSLKVKLKRAFAIILGAYFTSLVALFPLIWAGAGLLKGFAITTIIGITVGVLITRPAFSDIIKIIEE